jgi:enoyl-CoA hydratase/carnithine racemase
MMSHLAHDAPNTTEPDRGQSVPAATLRIEEDLARLTIGNGSRRNALGVTDWTRLRRLADGLSRYPDVKVVVVRGAAATFSAGSDIREWSEARPAEVDASFQAMEAALQAIERIEVPTIAVIEGVAAGAGCELALACDLRLMASSARLGMPILQLGILPSPAFTLRLSALAGTARTRELLYTGRLLDSEQAERYGLATEVVDDPDLDTRLEDLVSAITSQPRTGLVVTKAATGIELTRLRKEHDHLDWAFSDPGEFPRRIAAFLKPSA